MPSVELRDPLRRLAASTEPITLRRLWRALTVEERESGLHAMLVEPEAPVDDFREIFAQIIADARNFRIQTVRRFKVDKLVQMAARCELEIPDIIDPAVRGLHLSERRQLMAAFYSALDIEHDDGIADLAGLPKPAAMPLETGRAADTILATFDANHVMTFVIALSLMYPEQFPALREWCALASRKGAESPPAPGLSLETQAPPEVEPIPTDTFGFTTLDRRLIGNVVNTASDVIGALDEDELDDLLLEVLQLNTSRHQTYFHVGYRDALFGRELGEGIAAENEERRAWYWAGVVSALARSSKWKEIAELFDQRSGVREICAATNGSERAAAWIVFRALDERGRVGEARQVLTPHTVAHSQKLRQQLLATATRLIRESRAQDARPILELLWQACEHLGGQQQQLPGAFLQEVRRRRALCFRQLGETEAARSLLDGLAAATDPVVRAVALTDLGLLAASVRRLGEIVLPVSKDDVPDFLDNLKKGSEFFQQAAGTEGFRPAHAQFALGVIDFLERRYPDAVRRFDEALTVFNGAPDVYGRDRTLHLANLYLGLSICHAMDSTGDLTRARDAIVMALHSGASLPVWLVADTIDALAAARSDIASDVATTILESSPDSLDELLNSASASTIPGVRPALSKRAGDPSRSRVGRAVDYRRVLPLHLAQGDIERASDALSFLEEAAAEGVDRAEFLELLENRENYDPAWDEDRAGAARVYLLEVQGRLDEAAAHLEARCHLLLASSDSHALDDADLVFAHMESLGTVSSQACDRVRGRLEALLAVRDATEADIAAAPSDVALHLLVVGGNETQARMDSDIQAAIAELFPKVSVQFLHTGWSGNWAHYCKEFDRRCRNIDGVVFLSLMRTMLGRRLRQDCPVPWRGCGRGGKGAIVESLRRLVPFAAADLERRRAALENRVG